MPDAYLLDTSVATIAWDGSNPQHQNIRQRLVALDSDYISVCSISIGEVMYGLNVVALADQQRHEQIRRAMLTYKIWDIDRHVAETFADIRAGLFKQHGLPKKQGKRGFVREKQPEELIDRTTALSLGVQENDLWIVSVAITYNLKFITRDKRIQPILDVARGSHSYDRFEIWTLSS